MKKNKKRIGDDKREREGGGEGEEDKKVEGVGELEIGGRENDRSGADGRVYVFFFVGRQPNAIDN